MTTTIENLIAFTKNEKYNTIYADPPWQFQNRTGKVAPEHKRLTRYETMTVAEIQQLPVADIAGEKHIYIYGFQTPCFPTDSPLWMHGDSSIKGTSSGKKFEKTAVRMAAGSDFISET